MRRLTDKDLVHVIGTKQNGYTIELARIKQGSFTDSDNYGIMLGRNKRGQYVSWQFHIEDNENDGEDEEDEELIIYWGHYIEQREDAIRDYNTRDMDVQKFLVTITETLEKTVEIEAKNRQEAEQIVSDSWNKSDIILNTDNFIGADFNAVPMEEHEQQHE